MKINSTKEMQVDLTTWFFYGPTGSGKTSAAATFPKPLFIIPTGENSHLTLRGREFDYVEVGEGRGFVAEYMSILNELERRAQMADKAKTVEEAEAHFPWRTVVVESLTHVADAVINDLTMNGSKPTSEYTWGQLGTFFRNLHTSLTRLGVHVVFTALPKVLTKKDEVVKAGPAIVGSAADKLPSSCDVVAYFQPIVRGRDEESRIYRAHFTYFQDYPARSRFPGLPPHVDNFNFKALAPLIGAHESA